MNIYFSYSLQILLHNPSLRHRLHKVTTESSTTLPWTIFTPRVGVLPCGLQLVLRGPPDRLLTRNYYVAVALVSGVMSPMQNLITATGPSLKCRITDRFGTGALDKAPLCCPRSVYASFPSRPRTANTESSTRPP